MAFPLHLDAESIMENFDDDAFEKGKAIAAELGGCIALARLSGTDSMKPFWNQSSPTPSINSQDSGTSASSFYSAVKHIETPWRLCIISRALMNPWYIGIELTLLPIIQLKRSSPYWDTISRDQGWAPISPNSSSLTAVEVSPQWINNRSFVGIGYPFVMRCLAKKAPITSVYKIPTTGMETLRLQTSLIGRSILDNLLQPYPFRFLIHHYGELASFPSGHIYEKANPLGWNEETIEIATFLKNLLEAGNRLPSEDSMNNMCFHARLPVFYTSSEHMVYNLAYVLTMLAIKDLLTPHDCAALSLVHPCLTRPAQKLMVERLSIKTTTKARHWLGKLQENPDLLVLIDALHIDADVRDDLTDYRSLICLMSSWLSEISLSGMVDPVDIIGFAPGIKSIVLASKTSPADPAATLVWPFYGIGTGLINVTRLSLTNLTITVGADIKFFSKLELLRMKHCCVRYATEKNDVPVSIDDFFWGVTDTLLSLELVSVTGISPQGMEMVLRTEFQALRHLLLYDICPAEDPPVSLRAALAGKEIETINITQSGFTGYDNYKRRDTQAKQIWYGNEEYWDLLGGRTQYDHWSRSLELEYTNGDRYEPFSDDSD